MLKDRGHTQQVRINETVADVGQMMVSKEDVSSAAGTLHRLEVALNRITTDADLKQNKIETIERFIERYIPIRI